MKKIYQSYFYDFAHCDETNSLIFQWKPETETIKNNDFKEGLSNFAGYAFELKTPNMVVDVRNFKPGAGEPTPDVMGTWRAEVVIPRYNAAGVKKFAYLRNPDGGGPPVSEPTKHEGETFETAVFDSEEKMMNWLKA